MTDSQWHQVILPPPLINFEALSIRGNCFRENYTRTEIADRQGIPEKEKHCRHDGKRVPSFELITG